ncbi:UBA TS-N domain-containing [Chlorella sorokiniana]|uniref:UBA TS-N domain-containing n=1 Tax=Chlorella sorokiniana TaxID=3076 RepID=A0A2P6TJZ9_CHLSO|nr:UBA TS-N domain-containing [Chlorella sorokiniana]|eukprot:PRW44407.1 UBA TS-N domain-containing [Chlorella sorokiniana]
MYQDCTALDDEMDRRTGELLRGRRTALDDCLKLIRAALPLCPLIKERSRALAQLPPSNAQLHALSAMGLALMKGARVGQPPSPALDAAHRPAAEAAALARQQRRERPLSSAETLQLMSAVAATLAASAARLPAALRGSVELHDRLLKAMPAFERAESAAQGRAALQTSLLVPCCAADMLLRDMDIHAEAPHVQQLRRRTVTPQAVAAFLSAALEGAAVVLPRTGFEKPLWAELFGLLRRTAMPTTPADSEAGAVLLGPCHQLLGAPTQPQQRRNADNLVRLLLAFLRLPNDKPDVDTAQAIQEPAWRSCLVDAVELTMAPQLLSLIAHAGHLPEALQATALLLHRLPLKQPAGMAPADHAYLLLLMARLACKLLLFSWVGSEGPQAQENQPSLQQVAGLLADMSAAMGAVIDVHAVDLMPHAARAELEMEHPATMAGIAVAHFQKILMLAEFMGWGHELEAAQSSKEAWSTVAQLAAAAEALLRLGPKVQHVLPLLTDRRMLRPGGRTAAEIEGGSRSVLKLAGLVIHCLDQLLAMHKARCTLNKTEQQQAAAAWPAVHSLALSMGKVVPLLLEHVAPVMEAAAVTGGQKAAGDEAFREGRFEDAMACYTAALKGDGEYAPTLCNRSLAALKLGHPEASLEDAEAALQLLLEEAQTDGPGAAASGGSDVPSDGPLAAQLTKAFHRKAEALLALGQVLDGIKTYRQAVAICGPRPELHAALRLAAEQLPVPWLAKYWAAHIEEAQAPNPLLSARDGRLIKPVPRSQRLEPADLQAHLQEALYPLQDEARDVLCATWAARRRPGKAEAGFFRAAAYLHAGCPEQALKDARYALVYGPQLEGSGVTALVPSGSGPGGNPAAGSGGQGGDAGPEGSAPAAPPPLVVQQALSAWPAGLALLSAAHEALADNVPAALAMQRALELDPECEDYQEAMERLLRRIPEDCAEALRTGGATGLEAHLAAQAEAAKPEYLRQRPKFYYYFEWMKKRIYTQYPQLPEAVMDKLLALEANELDLVLQYPAATRATVDRLLDVYHDQGPAALEGYEVPLLSWDEYQAIKEGGEAAPALPASDGAMAAAKGRLLEGGGGDGSAADAGHEAKAARVGSAGEGSANTLSSAPSSAAREAHGAVLAGGGGGQAGEQDFDTASEAGSVDVDELCELD